MKGPEWYRLWQAAGEPDDLDAREVGCPTCGAPAGRWCRRPSGHKAMGFHTARYDAALRARVPEAQGELFGAQDAA